MMKVILFFMCIIMCGVSYAAPLAGLLCKENSEQHIFQGDSDDLDIIYIDGIEYTYVKDHTVGDISFTEYAKTGDTDYRAYLQVNMIEGEDGTQEVKLVLKRIGDKEADFGGECTYDD
ncbi:hypothetical protein ABV23_RS00795 [Escherichia coli]|nr:hypothetical protein [Escherichia coli]